MKGFLPGVIVGILLILLLQKNNSLPANASNDALAQAKTEGYQLGQAEARKLCEQEKRKAMEEAYYAGFDTATTACNLKLRDAQKQFIFLQQKRDQQWLSTLEDSLANTTTNLHNHYQPKVAQLQIEKSSLTQKLHQLKSEKMEISQQFQQLMAKMTAQKIDPLTVKIAQRVVIGIFSLIICAFLSCFAKSRWRL